MYAHECTGTVFEPHTTATGVHPCTPPQRSAWVAASMLARDYLHSARRGLHGSVAFSQLGRRWGCPSQDPTHQASLTHRALVPAACAAKRPPGFA